MRVRLIGPEDFKAKVIDRKGKKGSKNGVISLTLQLGPNGSGIEPGHYLALQPLHDKLDIFHPFSITNIEQYGDDVRATIWFKIRGEATKRYAKLRKGEHLIVRAPIGKPFPIQEARFESYILVAGGIGWAGVMFLARKLRQLKKEVIVLLGDKTSGQITANEKFEKIGCQVKTIAEAGAAIKGFATDLLASEIESDQGKSMVVACGPKPMFEKVIELVEPYNNECWVVVEEMTVCGNGMCKICAVFVRNEISGREEVKYICEDGNAFSAKLIDRRKFFSKFTPAPIYSSHRTSKPMRTRLEAPDGRFLDLAYPTSNGAGCFNWQNFGKIKVEHLGLYEDKGTEFEPTLGNPAPRGSKFSGGNMLNSIGRASLGIDGYLKQEILRLKHLGMPCSVNLSAGKIEHYAQMAEKLNSTDVSALTLNISCPNVEGGNLLFGKSPKMTTDLVSGVRQKTGKILIVKLTPETDDIVAIAKAAKQGGADVIALINTFKGMDIDIWTRRPTIAKGTGGYSGPALIAKSIALVSQLYQAKLGLPIIGMGGISSWQDAAKLILVGANVVAPATIIFNKHGIFEELNHGLLRWMRYHKANNIQDMVGRTEFQIN